MVVGIFHVSKDSRKPQDYIKHNAIRCRVAPCRIQLPLRAGVCGRKYKSPKRDGMSSYISVKGTCAWELKVYALHTTGIAIDVSGFLPLLMGS